MQSWYCRRRENVRYPVRSGEHILTKSLSNGKQSGPRIGMEKGPLTGLGTGLSR